MAGHPIVVVNIISTAYAGSTWLNLMLGSHPEAFAVGEMKNMFKRKQVLCQLHGETCPFWSRFDLSTPENGYLQLARLCGKRFLVSNNSLRYLSGRGEAAVTSKYIHLVRDGRAVTASFMRKHPELSTWQAARRWAHDMGRNRRALRRETVEPPLEVGYERLKQDTVAELQRICSYLGMNYEPAMRAYWKVEHHYLGGNRGTLFGMMRKQDADLPEAGAVESGDEKREWQLDYYTKTDPAAFADERWKKELTPDRRRIFALAAGRLNRKHGYPAR